MRYMFVFGPGAPPTKYPKEILPVACIPHLAAPNDPFGDAVAVSLE